MDPFLFKKEEFETFSCGPTKLFNLKSSQGFFFYEERMWNLLRGPFSFKKEELEIFSGVLIVSFLKEAKSSRGPQLSFLSWNLLRVFFKKEECETFSGALFRLRKKNVKPSRES